MTVQPTQGGAHAVDAGRLWAGGAATAVVAALLALVGILVARGAVGDAGSSYQSLIDPAPGQRTSFPGKDHPVEMRSVGARTARVRSTALRSGERNCHVILGHSLVHFHQLCVRRIPDDSVLDPAG